MTVGFWDDLEGKSLKQLGEREEKQSAIEYVRVSHPDQVSEAVRELRSAKI